MKAQRIRIEHMRNPLGIDVKQPLVSWNGADGIRQVSYRVKAMGSLGTTYDSGMVKSSEMQTRIPAEFKSRERVAVSVLLNEEEEGAQEVNAFFEMGLGEAGDWKAKWINPEEEVPDKDGLRPASYLRKRFVISDLTGENSARLYATAHGVYNIYINGKHVDGFVMAPGVSEYNNLLQYQTYDVTELLQEGENEILAVLGNGWWRGTVTYDGFKNTFGEDVALLAQLELNGRIICMSDDTWEANQDGPLRDTDNMQGEVYDAVRELSDANWHPVQTADFGYENLRSSNCPYATEHETFKPTLLVTPRGEKVLDFGQNIAGYIGFDIKAHEGEQYCFSHGETLDGDGNFTIDNFQSCNYISRQEIRYTCKEGRNVYRPTNTFMGFRYVKVEGMEQINPEDFTAYAVYTDLEETLRFSCGHELVNQLVKMHPGV